MQIRREQPADAASVRALHTEAFGADGGEHGKVVADLVDSLRETITPASGLSLVAEDEGRILGHVMFTRSLLDAPERLVDVQVLSPLAVLPALQRQGIGSALVRDGLEAIGRQGAPLVFLEGDPRYYPQFGFVPAGDHGFRKPSLRIPDIAFQVVIMPAYEPWMTGTLVYSETFWRHDCVGLR